MIRLNDPSDGYAISERAHVAFNPTADFVIARVEDGELLGGNVYQNYTGAGGSIAVHMAGFRRGWTNNDMLWAAFDYPFNHCKCSALFGLVPGNNLKALEIDLRLGFKEITRIADVYPGGECCVVLRMRRDECRWLRLKPRGEFRRPA
jgi:hypothetical protein